MLTISNTVATTQPAYRPTCSVLMTTSASKMVMCYLASCTKSTKPNVSASSSRSLCSPSFTRKREKPTSGQSLKTFVSQGWASAKSSLGPSQLAPLTSSSTELLCFSSTLVPKSHWNRVSSANTEKEITLGKRCNLDGRKWRVPVLYH